MDFGISAGVDFVYVKRNEFSAIFTLTPANFHKIWPDIY